MRSEDQVRLRHMLDAARDAVQFGKGRTREDLRSDREFLLAVVKCVEIIGEAAGQVSAEGRAEAPALPWEDIVGMRHRLVHAYYDIDPDLVWSTLREDLPPLIRALQRICEAVDT
jgi:uncharacterized protein with HEPN domain